MANQPIVVSLKVSKVTVVVSSGSDKVILMLEEETPYPEAKWPGSATIDARQGYGAEWCRKVLNIEPEVIDTRLK